MARKDDPDVIKAFHRLTDAAEIFVNRAPRLKRIQTQRSSVLDAIADAQLVLSVHRLPKEPQQESHRAVNNERESRLARELQNRQHALHQLERRLKPLTRELHRLQRQAEHARRLLETALTEQEQENGSSGRSKGTA